MQLLQELEDRLAMLDNFSEYQLRHRPVEIVNTETHLGIIGQFGNYRFCHLTQMSADLDKNNCNYHHPFGFFSSHHNFIVRDDRILTWYDYKCESFSLEPYSCS